MCLHRQTYHPILVDSTGWIFCKFLNLTDSPENAKNRLRIGHLQKCIRIQNFNYVVEILKYDTKSKLKRIKTISYIQADLTKCQIISDALTLNYREVPDDYRNSVHLTYELVLYYNLTHPYADLINETIQDDKSKPMQLQANGFPYSYYFRVDGIGQIHSTIRSTTLYALKAKLRGDIRIHLFKSDIKLPTNVIMSLVKKDLLYYHFLHVDGIYLLKSAKPLSSYFDTLDDPKAFWKNSPISSILLVDDTMRIMDNIELPKHLNTSSLNFS